MTPKLKPKPTIAEPWYCDGIGEWRCRWCLQLKNVGHLPTCVVVIGGDA